MSESGSHSDADADADDTSTISFNRPGIWDSDIVEGPALTLPAEYADLTVGENLFVEFLHLDTGDNHVALRVPFERRIEEDEQKYYYSVRIAMDLAHPPFLVLDNSEDGAFYDDEKKCGEDYWPGQLTVKLLKFDGPSTRTIHKLSFAFLERDLTVGELIDVATDANMHKFVFLLYPGSPEDRWRGCADFILQYWLLVKKGIIAATTPEGDGLTDHIAFAYRKGQNPIPESVDKGDFVRFDRDETEAHVKAVYAAK